MCRLALVLIVWLPSAAASAQILPFVPRNEPDQAQLAQKREVLAALASESLTADQQDIDRAVEQLSALASPKQSQLYIVGSGAIGTAVEKKTDVEPTASGSIGFRVASDVSQWTTLVSILSTEPLIEDNPEAFLLSPASGARSLMVDWQRSLLPLEFDTNTPPRNLGVQVQGALASARWRDGMDSTSVTVASLTSRITFNLFAAHDASENLDYALRFDIGLPVHAVGSLSSGGRALRRRMLGTGQVLFAGLDAGATLLFGKMTVTARLAGLPPFAGDVPGVTGLRFTTGIAVQPDLFNLRSVAFR